MYIKQVKDHKEIITRSIQWGTREKPPLLLLHGFGSIATSWGELAEKLSDHYWVTAVDLPGHGNTASLDEYSIENFNDWLEGLLKHIYEDEDEVKPIAVGHSIGAELLLNFEALHQHSFKHLILLDGGYLSNELDLQTPLKENVENAITYYNDFQFNSWSDYLDETRKGSSRWNDEIKRFSLEKMICAEGKIRLKMDLDTVKGYIMCFHENEAAQILDKTRTNTLLLVSTLPEQANEIRRHAIGRITNEKIHPIFIKGVTHDLYLENPDLIGRIIGDWLSESNQ